tara:strand:- start:3142 stop:4212 length:1071 start_codon:yes stop_codon:yes gene_type:complete
MTSMTISGRQILGLAATLLLGLGGALLAQAAGLPIPYLLGSLGAVAVVSLTRYARTGRQFWFPQPLRRAAIATIGTMIGATFTAEILSTAPSLLLSLSAIVLFVAIAQTANYAIFRHVGRYDVTTSIFSAMPGGLIEAVTLGEKAGADVEKLSVQHFVRIVLVIVSVPTLFWLFTGRTVGSAAGQTLELSPAQWSDWLWIAVIAPVGVFLGPRLKLPASHMLGPMLLAAALHASGLIAVQGPSLLLNAAQLVVGSALGTMFARSTLRHLAVAMGLGALSVATMLSLATGFAYVLEGRVPMSFEALVISFAPGGVTEMSLVALSLGISPVLVTVHHIFRIIFTVSVAGLMAARRPRP